jgi:hypothetical protein
MRRSLSLITILAGAALVAACASQPRRPHFRPGMGRGPGGGPGGPGGPGMMRGGGLFVSPAGEPFRRTEGGPQPMRAWFMQADADHDGVLTLAEFQADFARYFAVLDTDHDGEIAPAEVARYEQEILPEMQSRTGGGFGPGMRMGGMGRRPDGIGGGGRRRGGGGMRRGGRQGDFAGQMAMMSGAARFGLLPIAHPIMDADINFNRGVSLAEFTQAAGRRFLMLDSAHNGRLTLEGLIQLRMQEFSSGRRDAPGLGEDGGDQGPPQSPPDGAPPPRR